MKLKKKLKKNLKKMKLEILELKKQIQKDRVIITDSCNPDLSAVISLKDGNFLIEKITAPTPTQPISETILKDNK